MKDKTGKIIRAGDVISYKEHYFDVIKYNGILVHKKGKLKLLEKKSMFDGACDGWLEELKGQENKIKVVSL